MLRREEINKTKQCFFSKAGYTVHLASHVHTGAQGRCNIYIYIKKKIYIYIHYTHSRSLTLVCTMKILGHLDPFFSCMNKCLKSDQTFSVSLNIYKSFHEITYMIWVAYESIPWTSVSQWTNIETICLLGFSIYMYLYYTVIHDYTWLQWGAAVLSWRIPHGHAIPDPAGRTPRPNTNMPK